MKNRIWVVNTGENDFEKTDQDLKKVVLMKPNRPIQLPQGIALKYIKYNTIFLCPDPERYFTTEKMKRLIIRDAGIGDLLLLEPMIRKIAEGNSIVTVATRFPDVFANNPNIKDIVKMETKDDFKIDYNRWDFYDDMRSYSETCENRDTIHRTDCYNQIFNLDINAEEKEPRLYFSEDEKSLLNKRPDRNYIGLACDGSHFFRRYGYGNELIDYILAQDKNNIVVIIGDGWEDGKGFIKAKRNKRVVNYQGKTSIRQAINVIKDLDYMVSVDTGLMHVALALHIPTVCIFSIIPPELRIDYYTGQKVVIYKDLECIGCGKWHMARCPHGDIVNNPSFIPPCLEITPQEIYEKIMSMNKEENKRITIGNEIKEISQDFSTVNINRLSDKKLVMPIIVQDESINLPRFIEMVMSHPVIGRVVAIDGGSNDNTVELLQKAGADVYIHPYISTYHDMQAMQRNISCSYVKDGERILIMDIDECFSQELSDYLPVLAECNQEHIAISRRTFNYFDDINDPSKQIKDYPDYQPRFFTWHRRFKWIGSPHHNIYNCASPEKLKKDIIHFECEGKDRQALENKWSTMHKATKEVYI